MSQVAQRFRQVWLGWRLIVLLYLVLFPALFRPMVYRIDPVGYYSWARSLLIDGDLDVRNEFTHYDMAGDVPTTPTGFMHNQWAAGSGLMWLPLMKVMHLAVSLGSWPGIAADGYSWPYVWAAAFTSTMAGLGAIVLTYTLARRLFGNFAALLASLVVWLATPLVYYQYYEPLFAHANDALLNAVFVLVWWHGRKHGRKPVWMFGLGLVIGAAIWLRVQNIIMLIIVLLEVGFDLLRDAARDGWKASARQSVVRIAPLAGGVALLLVPLLLFWHTVYGAWILNTYQATGGGVFDLRTPHMLDVLVSTNRGLFVWSPVTLLCLAGVWWLFRADRRLAIVLSGVFLLQLYIVGAWSHWAGGAAFGPRFWITMVPYFILGLAALVHYLDHRIRLPRFGLVLAGGFLVVWNFLLMLQYATGMVQAVGSIDLTKMVQNQLLVGSRASQHIMQRLKWLIDIAK